MSNELPCNHTLRTAAGRRRCNSAHLVAAVVATGSLVANSQA